ncbi:MAG: hypothetical protein U5R31_11675 [Acidimicrobiia bacterium]|nr:hypothetical protein [Acidimicrobiia bacterium]
MGWWPIALFVPGWLALVGSEAALAWDGSEFLFRTLHQGWPATVWGRWPISVLQVPALAVGRVWDVAAATYAFGAGLVLVPVVALVGSWAVAWRRRPTVAMWCSVGIGLVSLPGQLFLVAEGAMAAQLSWLLFALVLVGRRWWELAGAVALVVVLVGLHPGAWLLLAGVALAVLAAGPRWWDRTGRVLVGLCAAAAVVRLVLPISAYERELASIDRLGSQFWRSIVESGLAPAITGWTVAVVLLVAASRAARPRRFHQAAALVVLATLAPTLWWAQDPRHWSEAYVYRAPVVALSAGLLVVAGVALRPLGQTVPGRRRPVARPRGEQLVAGAAGLVYSVTLIAQGWAWQGLLGPLDDQLATADEACLPVTEVDVADLGEPEHEGDGNAFDHWAVGSLSVLRQGRDPATVVLTDERCRQGELRWYPLGTGDVDSGWFRLPDASRP